MTGDVVAAATVLALIGLGWPALVDGQERQCHSSAADVLRPFEGTWGEYSVEDDMETFDGWLTSEVRANGCAFVQRFARPDGSFSFAAMAYFDSSSGTWIDRYVLSDGRTAEYQWVRVRDEVLLRRRDPVEAVHYRLRLRPVSEDEYHVLEERTDNGGSSWAFVERTVVRRIGTELEPTIPGEHRYCTQHGPVILRADEDEVAGIFHIVRTGELGSFVAKRNDRSAFGEWVEADGRGRIELSFSDDWTRLALAYNVSTEPEVWYRDWAGVRASDPAQASFVNEARTYHCR